MAISDQGEEVQTEYTNG